MQYFAFTAQDFIIFSFSKLGGGFGVNDGRLSGSVDGDDGKE